MQVWGWTAVRAVFGHAGVNARSKPASEDVMTVRREWLSVPTPVLYE